MTADLHALDIEPKARDTLPEHLQDYFATCEDKLGFVPNVLLSYAFDADKLTHFINMCDELMLAESGVSKTEREMIAVVVSSFNHCYYCLVAHGAVVRKRTGDPELGEQIAFNYRVAALTDKQRAMLDFAWKLTEEPWKVGEGDRAVLRAAGWTDRDIWDIAAVTGFFNMSNRLAMAVEMMPNSEYHSWSR